MTHVPRLMAISGGRSQLDDAYTSWIEELCRAGVDAIQVREKGRADREVAALVAEAVRAASGRARIIVSGRPDVALACGADGVHLPTRGLPVSAVRRLVGARRLVGCSAHSIEEVRSARDAGADYVFFSPIYETPGKAAPVGSEALARAVAVGLPVLALGGITIERLAEVAAAGAAGVAGIRMFQRPGELAALVRAARETFRSP